MEHSFFSQKTFWKIVVNTISIFIVTWMLSGIRLENSFNAIAVAVVLALFNSFLRPLLILLTVPLTVFSMGISILFINAVLILLAGKLIPGFIVDSFGSAFWFSILMSIVSFILELPEKIRKNQIVFERFMNSHTQDQPFHQDQQSDQPSDFQDAEIVEDED